MAAVGAVEDSVPCCPRSPFAVVEAAHLTYVKHNTCLEDRGSWCWGRILGCKNTLDQKEEYCCMKSVIRILGAPCWWQVWEKGSWVRSKTTPWCRKSVSCRSEWMKSQVIQVIQPGVTKCQTSMPVAAGAKAKRATYHSHTTVFDLRDDYRMVRQKVPGFAPVIWMGDPAFRLEWSSPERTMNDRLSQEPLGSSRET
jgi:hypothetical protein